MVHKRRRYSQCIVRHGEQKCVTVADGSTAADGSADGSAHMEMMVSELIREQRESRLETRSHPTEPQTLLPWITAEQLESFLRFHAKFHLCRNFIYASLPDQAVPRCILLARFWAAPAQAATCQMCFDMQSLDAITATTHQMRFDEHSRLFAMKRIIRPPDAKEKTDNLSDARQLSSCGCITDSASHATVYVLRTARDGRNYHYESFVMHYGAERGQRMWDEAGVRCNVRTNHCETRAKERSARLDDCSDGAEQATTPQANVLSKNCKNKSQRKKKKRINDAKYEEERQENARIEAAEYEERTTRCKKMQEDTKRCDSEFVLPGGIQLQSAQWKDHLQETPEAPDAWKRMLRRAVYAVDYYVRRWRIHRSDYDAENIFDEIVATATNVTIANVGLRFKAIQMIIARDACFHHKFTESQRAEQRAAKRRVVIHFFAYHIKIGRLTDDAQWLPCTCCNEFTCSRNWGH
jgi:hypothetical protein